MEAEGSGPHPAAFELPTARQVVGRGLQLAFENAGEIRRASLYIGLLVLATAGPAILLLLVDLPTLLNVPWDDPQRMSPAETAAFIGLIGPLYVAGSLALLSVVAVSVDGVLLAAAVLAGRAAGRPLNLREALQRARQVFWRYGLAAFLVGLLSTAVSAVVGAAIGGIGRSDSLGTGLLGTLVGTAASAPFGYILTAIVIGDAGGVTALGRSVTLARARPRLAIVVAGFAFLSSALQTLGLGVAVELADRVATFLHLDLDPTGSGLLLAIPVVAAALVAFGSLAVTVSAIVAAPQISAFLGLTHYSAGLDRARTPASQPPAPEPPAPEPSVAAPVASWRLPDAPPARRARWVTIPMAIAILLEVMVSGVGIAATRGGGLAVSSADPMRAVAFSNPGLERQP